LVSDIPAGDGKTINLFLQCRLSFLLYMLEQRMLRIILIISAVIFNILDGSDMVFVFENIRARI
jgi:hypothetical protein